MRAVHRLLTIAGALLLLTGIIAGVANREVPDPHRFSAHVDAIRADPAVSHELGAVVTDRLPGAQPGLTAIRPLLEATATSVMASPATSRSSAAGSRTSSPSTSTTRGGLFGVVDTLNGVG